MYYIKIIIVIVLFELFSNTIFSQDCLYYYKNNCNPSDKKGYLVSDQSIGRYIMAGDTLNYSFEVIQGKDYRVSACKDSTLSDDYSFSLLNSNHDLLFYFDKPDIIKEYEFSVFKTQQLFITIIINQPINSDGYNQSGCLGVLIEHMIRPKMGF